MRLISSSFGDFSFDAIRDRNKSRRLWFVMGRLFFYSNSSRGVDLDIRIIFVIAVYLKGYSFSAFSFSHSFLFSLGKGTPFYPRAFLSYCRWKMTLNRIWDDLGRISASNASLLSVDAVSCSTISILNQITCSICRCVLVIIVRKMNVSLEHI